MPTVRLRPKLLNANDTYMYTFDNNLTNIVHTYLCAYTFCNFVG